MTSAITSLWLQGGPQTTNTVTGSRQDSKHPCGLLWQHRPWTVTQTLGIVDQGPRHGIWLQLRPWHPYGHRWKCRSPDQMTPHSHMILSHQFGHKLWPRSQVSPQHPVTTGTMDINTEHDITTINPAMAPSSCSGSEIMTPGGKEAPTSGYSSPYQLLSMRHEPLCLSLSPVPHHTFAPRKGTKWPLLSPSYAGQANPGGYVGVLPLFDPNGIRQTHGLSSQSRAGGPKKIIISNLSNTRNIIRYFGKGISIR